MAFYNDEEEDEQSGGGSAPQQTAAQSSTIGSSSQTSGYGSPDKSGSFVGIKSYLDANKNQSVKLGDQAANVINQGADQARNAVQNVSTKFNNQVDQNTLNFDQYATNLAASRAEALNDQQKAQVKKQFNASYQGPQAIADLGDDYLGAQKAVQSANQNVQNQGTEEGRKEIIRNLNSSKQYRGTGNLDNLLLQVGGGREKLKSAAEANKDVGGLLDTASQSAQEKAAAAKSSADSVKKQTRDAIGSLGQAVDDPTTVGVDESQGAGAFGNIQKYLREQASAANANKGRIAETISGIKDNPDTVDIDESAQLTPEILESLGLSDGTNIYNTDLASYLAANPADATEQDVIDEESLARYRALADLSGSPADTYTKVGSYDPYAGTRKQDLQGTLAEKKAAFDNAQKTSLDHAKTIMDYYKTYGSDKTDPWQASAKNYIDNPTQENLQKFAKSIEGQKAYYDGTYGNHSYTGDGAKMQQAILDLFDNQLPTFEALKPNRKVGVRA